MAGTRGPRLGAAVYRALDGVSDYACLITLVDGWECNLAVFSEVGAISYYRKIKFDPDAGPTSAKPGTVYVW